jgi:predicted permease
MTNGIQPPRFARKVLRFFVPADVRDSIDGDFAELYATRLTSKGRLSAIAWYWSDTMSMSIRFVIDALARTPRFLRSLPGAISSLDVRLSARLLIRNPGLTFVSGFGIAVAIGITTGFFGMVGFGLIPRLPLEDDQRIVALENYSTTQNNEALRSTQDFLIWRDQMKSVVEISAFRNIPSWIETGPASTEDITLAGMTASGFRVARVGAMLGRVLMPDDEVPGAPPVLIIGYDVWRARYAADSSIIGRQLRINDRMFTVIGVMPARYGFPLNHQYWTTLLMDPSRVERGRGPELYVFGRLAEGATMTTARAELAAIGQRIALEFPQTNGDLLPKVWRYTDPLLDVQGVEWNQVWLVQMAIALTVIIVAVNVAILVYARTAVRRSEIAVRTALGASRARIVGQLFVEAVALSLPPAIAGIALAQYGLEIVGRGMTVGISKLGGTPPFWMDTSIHMGTALFALSLALIVAMIVGVLPALQATGRRIELDLRQLGGATGLRLGGTWTALVVAQVAFAVAILPLALKSGLQAATGSFTHTTFPAGEFRSGILAVKRAVDQGTQLPPLGTRIDDLVRNLEANPSIAGVTFFGGAPVGPTWSGRIEVDGVRLAPDIERRVGPQGVDTAFFNLYGAGLLSGRLFASSDLGDSTRVVIVNRAFARRVLGGQTALGRRIRYVPQGLSDTTRQQPWFEIVGVVDDLRRNPLDPDEIAPLVYHPFAPERVPGVRMVIRTRGAVPSTFAAAVYNTIAATSSDLRLSQLASGAAFDAEDAFILELVGKVLSLILATVLLLSAAGVYSLMSLTVAQRRREIGIRTALGASQRLVMITVFSRIGRQMSIGVLLGAVIATILDRITGPVAAAQTVLLVPAVALLMLVVGFFAAFVPTRRGLLVQPVEALRAE